MRESVTILGSGQSAAPAGVELRAALEQLRADVCEPDWMRLEAAQVGETELAELIAVAEGRLHRHPRLIRRLGLDWVLEHGPSLGLVHALRLVSSERAPRYWPVLRARTGRDDDPRAIHELMVGLDIPVERSRAETESLAFRELTAGAARSWYLEHPEDLVARLADPDTALHALEILAGFRWVPRAIHDAVTGLALSGERASLPARRVLGATPEVRAAALHGLAASTARKRVAAAGWLAELADPGDRPALREALRGESSESVRAMIVRALAACGEDVSAHLAPEELAGRAALGLARPRAAPPAWLDLDRLPAVRWAADGARVDPVIIRWWVVLAEQLGRARTAVVSAPLDLYLPLLRPEDAAGLADGVVRAWLEHDLAAAADPRTRELAEAEGLAAWEEALTRLQESAFALPAPQQGALVDAAARPPEQYVAEALRRRGGSEQEHRGLASFAIAMDRGEVVELVHAALEAHRWDDVRGRTLVDMLALSAAPPGTALDHLAGRPTTTAALRRTLSERGYVRGAIGTGGSVSEYTWTDPASGITAAITFSGADLPEEDAPCTIGRLELRRARRALPLHLAPPRLLAWCWSDYRALARPGAGNGGGDGARGPRNSGWRSRPDPGGAGDGADAGSGGAVGADTAGDGAGS